MGGKVVEEVLSVIAHLHEAADNANACVFPPGIGIVGDGPVALHEVRSLAAWQQRQKLGGLLARRHVESQEIRHIGGHDDAVSVNDVYLGNIERIGQFGAFLICCVGYQGKLPCRSPRKLDQILVRCFDDILLDVVDVKPQQRFCIRAGKTRLQDGRESDCDEECGKDADEQASLYDLRDAALLSRSDYRLFAQ